MIENNYVKVKGIDNSEIVELPLELDNTLSFEVLSSQFPYSTGLKYRNPKNNQIRTVRRTDGKLFLSPEFRWDEIIFFCYCPSSKRKLFENPNENHLKFKKSESLKTIFRKFPETFDLLAIGLSYDTTEKGLYEYLNRFGKLMYCKLKYDDVLGYSRGVAYFRFMEMKSQNLCLSAVHVVDKTKIIIKIPNEKINIKQSKATKLYINNLSTTLTREDIRAYFNQFGQVIHVFMPPDKRNFAFVTFLDYKAIERVIEEGQTHCFNGARVNVYRVMEKEELQNISLLLPKKDFINHNNKRKLINDIFDTKLYKSKISKPEQKILSGNYNDNKNEQYTENVITSHHKSSFDLPNFTQPPPLLFPSFPVNTNFTSNPPSTRRSDSMHSSIPFYHTQDLSPSPISSTHSNHSNMYQNYSLNHQIHSNYSKEPDQSDLSYSKTDYMQSPNNLTFTSFQNLLVNEIASQYKQQRNNRLQSFQQLEKFDWHSSISSEQFSSNCNQLENLVNKVCLLKNQYSRFIAKENFLETVLNKYNIKSNENNLDLSMLNDPKLRKALEILTDPKVLDSLMQISKTNHNSNI